MAQNYKVLVYSFGSYGRDSVVPEWVVERAGPIPELVAQGVVEPTSAAVNVDLRVPEPKTETDVSPQVTDELNRLQSENKTLAADNASVSQQVEALRRELESRDKAMGNQTFEIDRLREENDKLADENQRLMAELEEATKPAEPDDK